MHDFTDFPSAKFHEIWTQHVDRCRNKKFRKRILKILLQVIVFPPKTQKFLESF